MHERLKASEVGQIECQTCEKKNLCSKKNFRENFFEIFFMESYPYPLGDWLEKKNVPAIIIKQQFGFPISTT